MALEPRTGSRLVRTVLSLMVAAAGVLSIVGSGGGAVGFPPCGPPVCGPPPPPPPVASVTPEYLTVQVGAPVSWTVSVANLPGPLSYQWLRRDAGASNYVEIAGATAASYGLVAVNLADDGARFLVAVSNGSGFGVQAIARLVVSATPGLVFSDGEFAAQDWVASPVQPGDATMPPVVLVERIDSGGNPGAWQRVGITPASVGGAAAALFFSATAVYDPAATGAVKVIDQSQDCGLLPPTDLRAVEFTTALEQSGRRYLARATSTCNVAPWGARAGHASLSATDFTLINGPACASGESCPDFSSSGAPMRFGYYAAILSSPGVTVSHAVDNWRVTVWR